MSVHEEADRQLIESAYQGDVNGVKRWLISGGAVNARYIQGGGDARKFAYVGAGQWTPLIACAVGAGTAKIPQNHVLIVDRLIEAGAILDLDDGYGGTALFHAIQSSARNEGAIGAESIALSLMRAGANCNTTTMAYVDGPNGITPLHLACRNPRLVKALIACGANANAADSRGWTALHWACFFQEIDSVQLLIDSAEDVNVLDEDGHSPMWLVMRERRGGRHAETIRQLLVSYGPKTPPKGGGEEK